MKPLFLAALAVLALAAPASAQPGGRGSIGADPRFMTRGNDTGGARSVVVPRGATGADTYFSNSAVGGNVARPELAVPNGSAGGAGGGGNR